MKTLAIIGSTGSIGKSALNVYSKNKKKFNLLCLAANTNLNKLKQQKKKYSPKKIFLLKNTDKIDERKLKIKLDLSFLNNSNKKIDYIISGISGYQSIDINFKLLKFCKYLLIANKETIICGGKIFLNEAKKNNCKIIPIDSEHFCIDFFLKKFKFKDEIEKIYITASGGPFLFKKIHHNERIHNVINHPIWKMGKKISVDSSNFANKVLEIFEAKFLFNLNYNQIEILVENKSNVHAIIKLKNKLYFPIMHKANMELTISNSLMLNSSHDINIKNLNINFLKPNTKKFPIITIGYEILKKYDHSGMILFTVLNDRLVNSYLSGKIKYGEIKSNLIKAFNNNVIKKKSKLKINNKKDIFSLIKYAQNFKL